MNVHKMRRVFAGPNARTRVHDVAVVGFLSLLSDAARSFDSSLSPVVCGKLVPGCACSPNTEYVVLIKEPSTEAECITACQGELLERMHHGTNSCQCTPHVAPTFQIIA